MLDPETEMHSAFSDWFDHFAPDFQTTTNVRRYSEMTVVVYHLNFTIFGHDVSPSIPLSWRVVITSRAFLSAGSRPRRFPVSW